MASSTAQAISNDVGVFFSGFPSAFAPFVYPTSVQSAGFLYPGGNPVFMQMLGVNNCPWAQCVQQIPEECYTSTLENEDSTSDYTASSKASKSPHHTTAAASDSGEEGSTDSSPKPTGCKRGRKLLRPQDPVRRKTEQKDKYWFRNFRSYMRDKFPDFALSMSSETQLFWQEYLSLAGRPSKGGKYPSYSKEYKNFLFSHPTFEYYFRHWFATHGAEVLCRKYPRESDLWFVFYDYAACELVNYGAMHRL